MLQLLTKNLIKTNKTPHIVEIYKKYYCDEIPKSFFSKCLSYTEYLLSKGKADNVCNYLYRGYPNILNKGMYIADIEYCDSTLSQELVNISKKSEIKITESILCLECLSAYSQNVKEQKTDQIICLKI